MTATSPTVPHVHIGHYLNTNPMSPAEWGITDIRGHALNGAIIARTGAGTSSALARIAAQARAAGIQVWYLDGSHLDQAVASYAHLSTTDPDLVLDRGRHHLAANNGHSRVLLLVDHTWLVLDDYRHQEAFERLVLAGPVHGLGVVARTHTLSKGAFGTDDELEHGLSELTAVAGPAPSPGPHLVLIDSDSALRCAPYLWERLLCQADRLRVSVVARVHSLAATEMGTGVVRDLLLAHGQYLALGRPMGRKEHLVRALLHGYTAPTRRQKPGRGVYGYQRRATAITVERPQSAED